MRLAKRNYNGVTAKPANAPHDPRAEGLNYLDALAADRHSAPSLADAGTRAAAGRQVDLTPIRAACSDCGRHILDRRVFDRRRLPVHAGVPARAWGRHRGNWPYFRGIEPPHHGPGAWRAAVSRVATRRRQFRQHDADALRDPGCT